MEYEVVLKFKNVLYTFLSDESLFLLTSFYIYSNNYITTLIVDYYSYENLVFR